MSQSDYGFYGGTPPHQPTITSLDAAIKIEKSAKTFRGMVYREITRQGRWGATDDEMQVALDMNPSTQRPRRRELQMKGLVVDAGLKRTTRGKRRAIVWVAYSSLETQMEMCQTNDRR